MRSLMGYVVDFSILKFYFLILLYHFTIDKRNEHKIITNIVTNAIIINLPVKLSSLSPFLEFHLYYIQPSVIGQCESERVVIMPDQPHYITSPVSKSMILQITVSSTDLFVIFVVYYFDIENVIAPIITDSFFVFVF